MTSNFRLFVGAALFLVGFAAPREAESQALFADSAGVNALKEAARSSNPELLSRRAAVAAARARALGVGFAPAAALGAEVEEVPGGLNVARAGSARIDLTREFLPRGLGAARRVVAERDVERAQAEMELAERSLGARVDFALAIAVGATGIANRLAAEDSLLAAAEEGVRSRFSVGEARYVDVLRLRTERLRVRSEAAASMAEARIGRQVLAALLGGGSGAVGLVVVVDSVIARELLSPSRAAPPPPPPLESLVAMSAAARLGEVDVARAHASRAALRAEQNPAVSAFVGMQRFSGEDRGYSMGPTIGASVKLPFTARRANRALLLAADREVAAAEARRVAATAWVRTELTAAYERYEAARERFRLFDAALLQGARAEREGALASYRSGELSLLELLDFERALAHAENARLRSRMEAAEALADLVAAAGPGLRSEPSAESPERD